MKNKFIKALLLTTSICATIPFNGLAVSAKNNCADSPWKGGEGGCSSTFSHCWEKDGFLVTNTGDSTGKYRKCSVRCKKDDSSVYVYNQSSTEVKVEVMGTWGGNGNYPTCGDSWSVSDTLRRKGYKDLPKTWYVPANSKRFIPQYINEKGWGYAHIHFITSGTYGFWSPDSVGSYSNANKQPNQG